MTSMKTKKSRDRGNYQHLMSGIAFNEAETLVSNWNQVLSVQMTSFEFALPCMFPLPLGHTITPINPVEIDSPESANILASFKKSGIADDATLSYLLDNPLFLTWIYALLKDPTSCIPSSISSVPFGNFPYRSTYKKGVLSFRKIAADYLKTVGGDPTLQDLLLRDPDIIFSEHFPPEGISCSISFPSLRPSRTFPEDRASINPTYQTTTGNQPPNPPFRHLRASPLSFSRPEILTDHLDVF